MLDLKAVFNPAPSGVCTMDEPINVPKGIKAVKWTNKDGSESIRFRVRIRKQGINFDGVFESLINAIEARNNALEGKPVEKRPILNLPKAITSIPSPTGNKEFDDKFKPEILIGSTLSDEDKERYNQQKLNPTADLMGKFLIDTPFSYFVNQYFTRKIKGKSDKPTAKNNEDNEQHRINSILATLVEYKRPMDTNFSGFWETLNASTSCKLGDVPAKFVDHLTINSFILTALQKKAKSTVRRDLNTISAVINYAVHVTPDFYKQYWLINPVKLADKSRLAGHNNPLDRRLTEEQEEAIIKALKEYSNKEVLQIFLLALLTGARRSEILFLEWSKIKGNHIELEKTKNGRNREALITDEAKSILDSVTKRKDDKRLFTYTLDGFNTVWQRIKNKAKIKDLKFHDCRREFIARCIELMNNPSAIAIANMTGMSDMNYLEKLIDRMKKPDLNTEEGLQRQVGHSSKKMLRHYASGVLATLPQNQKQFSRGENIVPDENKQRQALLELIRLGKEEIRKGNYTSLDEFFEEIEKIDRQ